MDGATLKGIDSTSFAGKTALASMIPRNNTLSGMEEFAPITISNPADGNIYLGGKFHRRVNKAPPCNVWNFTETGWGLSSTLAHVGGVVKLTSALELPLVRG